MNAFRAHHLALSFAFLTLVVSAATAQNPLAGGERNPLAGGGTGNPLAGRGTGNPLAGGGTSNPLAGGGNGEANPLAGGNSRNGGTASGRGSTVVLQPVKLRDPGFGIDSHVAMVPKGWRVEGGVRWTPHAYHYAHFVARIQSPEGVEVAFDYNRPFQYGNFERRMGQTLADGTVMRAPVRGAGATAVQFIVPGMRPNARNIRILSATRLPDAEQKVRKGMETFLRMQQQNNIRDRQWGVRASTWIVCEQVRVAYDEGGRRFEEELVYTLLGNHSTVQNMNIRSESGLWLISDTKTARAPMGQLDRKLRMLVSLAKSIRPLPRWSISFQRLNSHISQVRHQNNMRNLRQTFANAQRTYRINSEISDSMMASWRRRQASSDRIHHATINSIRGVEDFRSADGTTVAVDNTYDRVFRDGLGNVIMTNDPSYDPRADQSVNHRNWDPMQRVR